MIPLGMPRQIPSGHVTNCIVSPGSRSRFSVVSYVSGTYVIEAIAGVNALHSLSKTSAVTNKRAEAMSENITSVEEGSSEAVPFLVHTEDTWLDRDS
ncbi:hypothetical protein AC1031_017282 [Aphanomyces cochlioides]|nr:hypothetical protein AC1031_017282 [Aphanomyces cochlioides]